MFNANSGYVGISRSIRSQEAIDSYEVPLSMINKSLIHKFLKNSGFSKEEILFLSKTSAAKWKFVAKKMPASSWHHTSLYFNQTHHYDLNLIAEKMLDIKDTLDDDYQTYLNNNSKKAPDIKYGVIKVQVWGGSRKHPKVVGYEKVAGIIVNDWLFYKNNHEANGGIAKFKTTANKVEWLKIYDSYADLVKNHEGYKNSKKVFNSILKEKGGQEK